MPRYAITHNISGVVRGMATAANPVSACRLLDCSLGDRGRVYEEHDPRSRSALATASAYAVYEAGVGFPQFSQLRGIIAGQIEGLVKVAVVVVRRQR